MKYLLLWLALSVASAAPLAAFGPDDMWRNRRVAFLMWSLIIFLLPVALPICLLFFWLDEWMQKQRKVKS